MRECRTMIQHYFKIAFRNILKYKTQSIISILGLAVGFTCFALANLWIHYEMTYDAYHEGPDVYPLQGKRIWSKRVLHFHAIPGIDSAKK